MRSAILSALARILCTFVWCNSFLVYLSKSRQNQASTDSASLCFEQCLQSSFGAAKQQDTLAIIRSERRPFAGRHLRHYVLPARLAIASVVSAVVPKLRVHPVIHWWRQFTTNFDELRWQFLVANWKCDWCQFLWLGGCVDVAMAVHLLLT